MTDKTSQYQSAAKDVKSLGTVVPKQLVEDTSNALHKLEEALGGDVSGYVANRLHMSASELNDALAAEQVDGVALAMYNIEKRAQSVIIGDQTGIGKGRQAAAMIRYGLLSGYLPVFFTDRYTLFSDMYRDCKALGIQDARPMVVNANASVVDFDRIIEEEETDEPDEIWSPSEEDEDQAKLDEEIMRLYQRQYEVVYKAPPKRILQQIFEKGELPADTYDYLMITYSQLKDTKRNSTRYDFLLSLCKKHRVLLVLDEAHRSSSVSAGNISVITQCINSILTQAAQTQCVFLSATFAKRPESLITFMRRTALSALATEGTLETALHEGGVPMQEYVSSSLAAEGQMIRREHSTDGLPEPVYTYLDDDIVVHGELFDKVMYFFREIVRLSDMVRNFVDLAMAHELLEDFKCYPARAQLFYINKVVLLSLKAQKVAETAVENVRQGKSVVIGMSDTLECILRDVVVHEDGSVRGDISVLLLRLLDKTVRSTNEEGDRKTAVFDLIEAAKQNPDQEVPQEVSDKAVEIKDYYQYLVHDINEKVFHLPMSPIDVIRQLITREEFVAPDGSCIPIRFEECTGRAHQIEYLSPDGSDNFMNAQVTTRKKRHSNHIFNDFQNNKLDVILINACGAIGASAHAVATAEVPEDQVRQRKMLIVQNDLDVNIDLQKRGRINRTGQRMDLPPLYEYIITAIPSEKRLNMMLRAKLRSLSANTAAWQDQDRGQADFIDICNKYGNGVAADYLALRPWLCEVLGMSSVVTASRLLARIAMLSVTAQQEIVDDLIAAYTALEAELRRINQWDLERDFRDFEAEFVREELFTTAKEKTRLGGCSWLTTYRCRLKTFPYSFQLLETYCKEATATFGRPYQNNLILQNQISAYYMQRNKEIRKRFSQHQSLLNAEAKHVLTSCGIEESLVDDWLQRACIPSYKWKPDTFADVQGKKDAKQIMRRLVSFSNEHNRLFDQEKRDLEKYAAEKKRLVTVLSKAVIGQGYRDISAQLASDECPGRVIAVLRDIRFGKEERNRFMPSRVELVFALTAVFKEIHINLVHNKKWSNYERLLEILDSNLWQPSRGTWDAEIARNNNKIVERKIITGNILGAFVHPDILDLKPRFITFSLKGRSTTQTGLLLPMDESKIRDAVKNVGIPLHEGIKYANNTNTRYVIAGLKINFLLLPVRVSVSSMKFVVSVFDKHSRIFECDKQFDGIRPFFTGTATNSIYDAYRTGKKLRPLMHYQTEQLDFESEALQTIIQTLAQMDAAIIFPREQLTYGDVKEYSSRSLRDLQEPWAKLDWKNADEVPMPPIKEKLLLRITAPVVPKEQKGKAVFKHSEHYKLAEETLSLSGMSLGLRSTLDALRRTYLKWKDYYTRTARQRTGGVVLSLKNIIENKAKATAVVYDRETRQLLQDILDSEYLEPNDLYVTRFENEMLFMSPKKDIAQAFIDQMPCSPRLDDIRKCIQDYIDGNTDIINSPD